jgi:hypothetical protein
MPEFGCRDNRSTESKGLWTRKMPNDKRTYVATVVFGDGHVRAFTVRAENHNANHVGMEFVSAIEESQELEARSAFAQEVHNFGKAAASFDSPASSDLANIEQHLKSSYGNVQVTVKATPSGK